MVMSSTLLNSIEAPAPRYMMRLALLDRMVERLPEDPKSFVEFGPGLGDLCIYFRKRFSNSTGTAVDLSEDSAAALARRTPSDSRLVFVHDDLADFEPNGPVDLVIACEVLEHLEDDRGALDKIASILTKGGHALLSVPAHARKWGSADVYAGHQRRYERSELVEKIVTSGLDMVELWSYGFPVTTLLAPISRYHYTRMISRAATTAVEASKRSGSARPLSRRLSPRLVFAGLLPFILVQSLVKHLDIGDGYIALCRRTDRCPELR